MHLCERVYVFVLTTLHCIVYFVVYTYIYMGVSVGYERSENRRERACYSNTKYEMYLIVHTHVCMCVCRWHMEGVEERVNSACCSNAKHLHNRLHHLQILQWYNGSGCWISH